jgi:hypothetical protein
MLHIMQETGKKILFFDEVYTEQILEYVQQHKRFKTFILVSLQFKSHFENHKIYRVSSICSDLSEECCRYQYDESGI